jgi:hypothetical protein
MWMKNNYKFTFHILMHISNQIIAKGKNHYTLNVPPLQNNDETFSAQNNAMSFGMSLWQLPQYLCHP